MFHISLEKLLAYVSFLFDVTYLVSALYIALLAFKD